MDPRSPPRGWAKRDYAARLKSPSREGHFQPRFESTESSGDAAGEQQQRMRTPSSARASDNRNDNNNANNTNNANNDNNNNRNGSTNSSSNNSSVYSDRFIPSRSGSNVSTGYSLLEATGTAPHDAAAQAAADARNDVNKEAFTTYSMLLKSELLGMDFTPSRNAERANGTVYRAGGSAGDRGRTLSGGGGGRGDQGGGAKPARNLFRFKAPRQHHVDDAKRGYSLSPLGSASERLLSSPRKAKRKIAKVPFKVLDAPALQDDFYLNLVDWSAQNVLAVGLGSCVYLWSACTSKVTKLCDLGPDDTITSVSWTQKGQHLAVGTNLGDVQIWDAIRCKKVRTMGGHSARVGTMCWNAHVLASGSRDRLIYQRDVRVSAQYVSKLVGHKQEVCGLRWSFDDQQLASGGNDNKLFIWSAASTMPVMRFNDHTAAVKAIAWSPHQHGLLSSGGGTADRCIRFWNTLTGAPLHCVDTGSQVCNLMWSKNINEVVSTHGYSLNQVIVWRYPSMAKVATLTGHTYRVLYLAMSPDGQTIVTGAGDETLRFWSVFPGPKNKGGSRLGTGLLFPSGADIR